MMAVSEDKEKMVAVPENKEPMVAVPEEREKAKRRKNYRLKNESKRSIFRRRGPIRFGREIICNEYSEPCPRLVTLYARLGLHRYNLLQGKNLQLSSVMKYNRSTYSSAYPYDITLEAMNDLALLPFQTTVYETSYGQLALSCSFARPLGKTNRLSSCSSYENFFLMDTMPEWPPEDPFEHSDRYYVLNESELQDDIDCIRLYLELAVATTNRDTIKNHDLSNLQIIQVARDTTPQDVDLVFNGKNVAIFYIRYKDSCEARVGKDVDRVAIVRRAFYEKRKCFALVGKTLSLGIIPTKGLWATVA